MVGELIEGVIGFIVEVIAEVVIDVLAGDEKKKDDGDD